MVLAQNAPGTTSGADSPDEKVDARFRRLIAVRPPARCTKQERSPAYGAFSFPVAGNCSLSRLRIPLPWQRFGGLSPRGRIATTILRRLLQSPPVLRLLFFPLSGSGPIRRQREPMSPVDGRPSRLPSVLSNDGLGSGSRVRAGAGALRTAWSVAVPAPGNSREHSQYRVVPLWLGHDVS